MGYSPWSREELDMTERLTLSNTHKREGLEKGQPRGFLRGLGCYMAIDGSIGSVTYYNSCGSGVSNASVTLKLNSQNDGI